MLAPRQATSGLPAAVRASPPPQFSPWQETGLGCGGRQVLSKIWQVTSSPVSVVRVQAMFPDGVLTPLQVPPAVVGRVVMSAGAAGALDLVVGCGCVEVTDWVAGGGVTPVVDDAPPEGAEPVVRGEQADSIAAPRIVPHTRTGARPLRDVLQDRRQSAIMIYSKLRGHSPGTAGRRT
jgi:hypothetical protein